MALGFPLEGEQPKHYVALGMLPLPKQVALWLGLDRAGLNVALGADCWQTKHHVALGHLNPKPVAQRHLALALLPLGCNPSAM